MNNMMRNLIIGTETECLIYTNKQLIQLFYGGIVFDLLSVYDKIWMISWASSFVIDNGHILGIIFEDRTIFFMCTFRSHVHVYILWTPKLYALLLGYCASQIIW